MWNRITAWLLALALATVPAITSAQSPQVRALVLKPTNPAPAVAYVGPGDISTTNVVAWFGLRGFKNGFTGNAINVCNAGDAACANMVINSSGNLVVTTVGGTNCAVATCTIKTLYDQSGALACVGGIACDVTQATEANRYQLVVSCVGGKPCLGGVTSPGSGQQYVSVATLTGSYSAPFTFSAVVRRDANFTTLSSIAAVQNPVIGFDTTVSKWFIYAGGSLQDATASDSNFHAIQSLLNGASSAAYIDGSNTGSLNPGTGVAQNNIVVMNNSSQPCACSLGELGLWSIDTSANNSAMNSNQHAYWGF